MRKRLQDGRQETERKEGNLSLNSQSVEFSVVIPTLNEGEHLQRTVDSLLASSTPRTEVIVVDDGSSDGSTDFLVRGYRDVRLLRHQNRQSLGAIKARNHGAAH